MKQYKVRWEIDLEEDTDDLVTVAAKAREMNLDPESTAVVYTVITDEGAVDVDFESGTETPGAPLDMPHNLAKGLYKELSDLIRRIERDNLHTTRGVALENARKAIAACDAFAEAFFSTPAEAPLVQGIKLNDRELATVLAALRYFQETCDEQVSDDFYNDQFDGDPEAKLSDDEIDELCERLVCGDKPILNNYRITVTQIADELSDVDDREGNPAGTYDEVARTEDEALDQFHTRIPIGCLDDFEITCEEVK